VSLGLSIYGQVKLNQRHGHLLLKALQFSEEVVHNIIGKLDGDFGKPAQVSGSVGNTDISRHHDKRSRSGWSDRSTLLGQRHVGWVKSGNTTM